MSQLGTDQFAATLLDDLDEKVQQLDVNDIRTSPTLDPNDLGDQIHTPQNPYFNIEINPTTEIAEPKGKSKLSQMFRKSSTRKSIEGSQAAVKEIEFHSNGADPPSPDAVGPDGFERASSETDKELSLSLGSKTRLPTLPPKDPAEERKHLEQFQKMMVAAKQRDAAKAAEAEKARVAKEEAIHRLTRLWNKDILPNWSKPGVLARAEKIVLQGIPSSCRGQVWSRCLQGQSKGSRPSALTSETYAFLLQRAKDPPPPYLAMTLRNAKLIAHDAAGVFPELGLFGPGFGGDLGSIPEPGPYYTPLLNVLSAHASLAPTELYGNRAVGSLAGVLLLHMDEEDAFLTLQGLLTRPMHAAFALSTPQASVYLKAFDIAFCENLPRLHKHFQQAQLKSEMFLTSWLGNLFTKHLSLEVCCHVWDCYLVIGDQGDEVLFMVALVMLGWLEPHLYGRLDEALGYLGQSVPLTLEYLMARLPGSNPSQTTPTVASAKASLPRSVLDLLAEARMDTTKKT